MLTDGIQCGQPGRFGVGKETHRRHDQNGRVEHIAVERLHERLRMRMPATGQDLGVDGIASGGPSGRVGRPAQRAGEADHPVKHDPCT